MSSRRGRRQAPGAAADSRSRSTPPLVRWAVATSVLALAGCTPSGSLASVGADPSAARASSPAPAVTVTAPPPAPTVTVTAPPPKPTVTVTAPPPAPTVTVTAPAPAAAPAPANGPGVQLTLIPAPPQEVPGIAPHYCPQEVVDTSHGILGAGSELALQYTDSHYAVVVCSDGGRFAYHGESLSTGDLIALPAYPSGIGFEADNGDVRYLVDTSSLRVFQGAKEVYSGP